MLVGDKHGVAEHAVIAAAGRPVIYPYAILVDRVVEIAFDGTGFPFETARGNGEILIVVASLFQQYGCFVFSVHEVIVHKAFGAETSVGEIAFDEYVISRNGVGIKREVDHHVVASVVGVHEFEASALSHVVIVGFVFAGKIVVELDVIEGIFVGDRFDVHARIGGACHFKSAIFVSGRVDERAQVFIVGGGA